MYPISQLISNIVDEYQPNMSVFIRNLGYRNINKGMRYYQRLIQYEDCSNPIIMANLAYALGVEQSIIDEAISKTMEQKRAELEEYNRQQEEAERKVFQPYVFIRTKGECPLGGCITIVGIVGAKRFKHLPVPADLPTQNEETQIEFIKKLIAECHGQPPGNVPLFGPITGYYYRFSYDDCMEFSIDGELLNRHSGRFHEGRAYALV